MAIKNAFPALPLLFMAKRKKSFHSSNGTKKKCNAHNCSWLIPLSECMHTCARTHAPKALRCIHAPITHASIPGAPLASPKSFRILFQGKKSFALPPCETSATVSQTGIWHWLSNASAGNQMVHCGAWDPRALRGGQCIQLTGHAWSPKMSIDGKRVSARAHER